MLSATSVTYIGNALEDSCLNVCFVHVTQTMLFYQLKLTVL